MCVSYCYRQGVLFWNHDDCSSIFCPVVSEDHGSCQICRHRREEQICALTNAPLPEIGGCCHWNVQLVEGPVPVTPAMVAPLAGFYDTARNVLAEFSHRIIDDHWVIPVTAIESLKALGITYRVSDAGLLVDPDQLLLVIDEPIPDILDRLEAPYLSEPGTEKISIDPNRLQLPTTYGHGVLG